LGSTQKRELRYSAQPPQSSLTTMSLWTMLTQIGRRVQRTSDSGTPEMINDNERTGCRKLIQRQGEPEQAIHNVMSEYIDSTRDPLDQIPTPTALVEGVSDGGGIPAEPNKYSDCGLGTCEHSDCEMIATDGSVFQVCSDGSIEDVSARKRW
jgi:hypothetical protein